MSGPLNLDISSSFTQVHMSSPFTLKLNTHDWAAGGARAARRLQGVRWPRQGPHPNLTYKTVTAHARQSRHIQDSHGTYKTVTVHTRLPRYIQDSHGAYKTVTAKCTTTRSTLVSTRSAPAVSLIPLLKGVHFMANLTGRWLKIFLNGSTHILKLGPKFVVISGGRAVSNWVHQKTQLSPVLHGLGQTLTRQGPNPNLCSVSVYRVTNMEGQGSYPLPASFALVLFFSLSHTDTHTLAPPLPPTLSLSHTPSFFSFLLFAPLPRTWWCR